MPINIPDNLPAAQVLSEENIFFISQERAMHQDIRPLKIILLNLMPTKIDTETQIVRLLGNSPLQVDIVLLSTKTYKPKNVSMDHLLSFYNHFEDIKDNKYDGLIITGAPVEKMEFEEVEYFDELKKIMEWSKNNVFSTLHICWGAQAGLYYHYGIGKSQLSKKCFGVFKHTLNVENEKLFRGFDDEYYAPHSRYTTINTKEIENNKNLDVLSVSKEAGFYIVASKDRRQIFITGHSEYDKETLKNEYLRDVEKNIDIQVPQNYFVDDNPENDIIVKWRGHANLLYVNWLNYYVYQETPFDINKI